MMGLKITIENILKKIANKCLNTAQKYNNIAYEDDGLTDEILDTQIRINKLRHKADLPNPKELNEDGYLQ